MLNPSYLNYTGHALEEEKNRSIGRRVMFHRDRFRALIYQRYVEFLPLVISYTNIDTTAIDPVALEIALRGRYQVVIGKAKNEQIMILGYVISHNQNASIDNILRHRYYRLTKEDINFTVPDYLIPERCLEITHLDNCQTGNFIVVQNKPQSWVDEYQVIEHYADELAELVLSRMSLIMQSKFAKIFKSEVGDETINQMITSIYNGDPFIKVSGKFDADDDIVDIGSEFISSALVELKREYQNKISELNNFLGINSLAVDKESGVSDTEAKSNRGFTSSNASIYIKGRQAFDKLNKRFNLAVMPYYDDEPASKLSFMSDMREQQETESQKSEVDNHE